MTINRGEIVSQNRNADAVASRGAHEVEESINLVLPCSNSLLVALLKKLGSLMPDFILLVIAILSSYVVTRPRLFVLKYKVVHDVCEVAVERHDVRARGS